MGQPANGGPFDISILELKAEDELDLATYTPACLAKTSDRDSFDNQTVTVAGWGVLAEGGDFPDPFEPRDVELVVRPVSTCPGLYANGTEISPSDICAAVDGGGKDSCQVKVHIQSSDLRMFKLLNGVNLFDKLKSPSVIVRNKT